MGFHFSHWKSQSPYNGLICPTQVHSPTIASHPPHHSSPVTLVSLLSLNIPSTLPLPNLGTCSSLFPSLSTWPAAQLPSSHLCSNISSLGTIMTSPPYVKHVPSFDHSQCIVFIALTNTNPIKFMCQNCIYLFVYCQSLPTRV